MPSPFAQHFLLRDDVAYLNHGSYGACPKPVFAAYQAAQLELEREPVDFLGRNLQAMLGEVRVEVAKELGTHADNIVGLTNATVGLNIVAQSLDLKPGDQILTTDHEYAALDKTWAYVCRKTGAEIVRVEVPLPLVSEEQFTAAILAGMTERTKVLFLSHITSPTALLFPIEGLVAEARKCGIISVIDGAHVPGHMPLDLDALGADFYAGNLHKWLMTPKGSAVLYARPEMQGLLDPLIVSHGWTAESKAPGAVGAFGHTPFVDELEIWGTRDPAAWLAVPESIRFRAEHNWPQVQAECHELAQATARRIGEMTGLPPISTPEFSAPQMVSIPLPDCDTKWLHQTLRDKYAVEIPGVSWAGRSFVRVSAQAYNDQNDMDRLVEALGELLDLEQPKSEIA